MQTYFIMGTSYAIYNYYSAEIQDCKTYIMKEVVLQFTKLIPSGMFKRFNYILS